MRNDKYAEKEVPVILNNETENMLKKIKGRQRNESRQS